MSRPTWELRRMAQQVKETGQAHLPLLSMSARYGVRLRDESEGRAASEDRAGYLVVQPGDIVVNKLSARDGAIGRSELCGLVSPAYWVLRCGAEHDSRYLAYVLRSEMMQAEIGRVSKFMPPAQYDVAWEDFRSLAVPAASLEEQRRVADLLDDQVARIDNIVAARGRQVSLNAEERKSRLSALFATGSSRKLHTMLKQRPSYGVLVPRFVDEGGVPFIRVGDLSTLGDDSWPLVSIDAAQSSEYSRTVVSAGDLLLSVVGSVDKVALVTAQHSGCNIARAVARLQPLGPDFGRALFAWFQTQSYLDQARLSTAGDTAQPTLNMSDLAQFMVRLDDASRVADAAAEIIAQAAARDVELKRSVALLQEYKQSLISAAVSGDLDTSASSEGDLA